jgi:enoyl-CoA hydratase
LYDCGLSVTVLGVTTVREDLRSAGVLVISLDKPPANAIGEQLLADLSVALGRAADDDAVRAVVVTGTGAFFSGGFDFAASRRDDQVAHGLYRLYRDCHLRLLTLPKPTVAMVNGHAIAGGLVVALACDRRIAVDGDFRIGLNEVEVGASFPRAAFEIVRLRLTHAAATELILGAKLLPAHAGTALGLFSDILPPAAFERSVIAEAERLGSFPREAYAHAKAAFVMEAAARIEQENEADALRTMTVWITEESRAARRRQREKLKVRG